MALINCPECGTEISDKATTCPYCGATKTRQRKRTPAPAKTKKESNNNLGLKVILVSFAVMILLGIFAMRLNPSLFKAMPVPVVISSRNDNAQSTMLKNRVTVYATLLNQAGSGNIAVTFKVHQGTKDFTKTQSYFIARGAKLNVEATFDGIKRIDGLITHNVQVEPQ